MAKGMPSMVALLGLLAVAGYQNRDKLDGLVKGLNNGASNSNDPNRPTGGLGDMLGNLGGALGGVVGGGSLGGGLGELVGRFRQAGRSEKVDSWIQPGDNMPVEASDLEEALGDETIAELTEKTGLSRSELLDRLSQTLPDAVNQLTPDGRIPAGM